MDSRSSRRAIARDIVRTENGKQREIKIKLERLVNNGDMKHNMPLKPGDVLVVPESRF